MLFTSQSRRQYTPGDNESESQGDNANSLDDWILQQWKRFISISQGIPQRQYD